MGELNLDQHMNLTIGFPPDAFESDKDRRAAWVANREQLMAESPPGLRPSAFWDFDFRGKWPLAARDDREAVYLLNLGSDAERREIEDWWFYCIRTAKRRCRTNPDQARRDAIEHIGCPPWFWDAHHHEILTEDADAG